MNWFTKKVTTKVTKSSKPNADKANGFFRDVDKAMDGVIRDLDESMDGVDKAMDGVSKAMDGVSKTMDEMPVTEEIIEEYSDTTPSFLKKKVVKKMQQESHLEALLNETIKSIDVSINACLEGGANEIEGGASLIAAASEAKGLLKALLVSSKEMKAIVQHANDNA